jgi:hypothetical protein
MQGVYRIDQGKICKFETNLSLVEIVYVSVWKMLYEEVRRNNNRDWEDCQHNTYIPLTQSPASNTFIHEPKAPRHPTPVSGKTSALRHVIFVSAHLGIPDPKRAALENSDLAMNFADD